MVTFIFTGPQAQIPSSPYQQGLGLVRGYEKLIYSARPQTQALIGTESATHSGQAGPKVIRAWVRGYDSARPSSLL